MSSYLVPLTILFGTALVGSTVYDDPISSFKFGMGTGSNRGEAVREAVSDAIDALLDEYLEKGWQFDKEEARKVIKNESKFIKNFNIAGTTKIGLNFGVSAKVIFNTENIDKELTRIKKPIKKDKDDQMKGEKRVQKDKGQKGDKIKIITVEAEGSGASEEEARKSLFQAAIKKAADQLILETKTINEANKIKEESTNVNIGTIKKVFEIKFIKKENVIIAKGKVEVESKASQKEEAKKFETVISEGNGKSEEEALQDAIQKGIEKTIGVHIKSVEDLKNGIIKETIIEQLNASVSEKKILNTEQNKDIYRTTVFFEIDTSLIFKNLKEKAPTISKIDGASLAAQIESKRELARQVNSLIDIMIDDYFKCYEIEPITNIDKIEFSQQGNFKIKYKYYIKPNKYIEFSKKWVPIIEKINISKTTLSDKEIEQETGSRYNPNKTIPNSQRKDDTLSLIITNTKKTNYTYKYIVPGFIVDNLNGHKLGIKNDFFTLRPMFTFIDNNNKPIKEFLYEGITDKVGETKWTFFIRPTIMNLFFDPNSNGIIELESTISRKELENVAGIKAELKKVDIRPKTK